MLVTWRQLILFPIPCYQMPLLVLVCSLLVAYNISTWKILLESILGTENITTQARVWTNGYQTGLSSLHWRKTSYARVFSHMCCLWANFTYHQGLNKKLFHLKQTLCIKIIVHLLILCYKNLFAILKTDVPNYVIIWLKQTLDTCITNPFHCHVPYNHSLLYFSVKPTVTKLILNSYKCFGIYKNLKLVI